MSPQNHPEKPIVLYSTPYGVVKAKLLYDAETFWLNLNGED